MKGSRVGYGFGFTELSDYVDNFLSERTIPDCLRNRESSLLVLPGSGKFVLGR